MSIPPTANPNPLKNRNSMLAATRSSSGTDENEFRAKRKRYSYPLLGSYETELPGIQRLPLSPVKSKQGKFESSAAAVFQKPNILTASKGSTRSFSNRCASASVLLDKSSDFDIYEPMNSVAETFSPAFFNLQRGRILRRLRKTEDTDAFSVLPDEMVLKIFGFVGKPGLCNCMLVNQRFNELANDEVLWRRTDAVCKFLSTDSVSTIFSRNPAYLRLSKAFVADPVGLSENFKAAQLIYLDLSMAEVTTTTLVRILSMCNSLVKCSLEALALPTEVMLGMMSFCSSIETLNIAMCSEINPATFSLFLSRSPKLKVLNMGCIGNHYLSGRVWPKQELLAILTSLATGMEKLNISGFVYSMRDEHVEQLVNRLPRLKELDLSDSQEITQRSIHAIVKNLLSLESLGLSRCYNIPIGAYLTLSAAPLLHAVQLFAIFKEQTMTELVATLPQIKFNQEPISPIARPTVGNRRSTIWGERVRD